MRVESSTRIGREHEETPVRRHARIERARQRVRDLIQLPVRHIAGENIRDATAVGIEEQIAILQAPRGRSVERGVIKQPPQPGTVAVHDAHILLAVAPQHLESEARSVGRKGGLPDQLAIVAGKQWRLRSALDIQQHEA